MAEAPNSTSAAENLPLLQAAMGDHASQRVVRDTLVQNVVFAVEQGWPWTSCDFHEVLLRAEIAARTASLHDDADLADQGALLQMLALAATAAEERGQIEKSENLAGEAMSLVAMIADLPGEAGELAASALNILVDVASPGDLKAGRELMQAVEQSMRAEAIGA